MLRVELILPVSPFYSPMMHNPTGQGPDPTLDDPRIQAFLTCLHTWERGGILRVPHNFEIVCGNGVITVNRELLVAHSHFFLRIIESNPRIHRYNIYGPSAVSCRIAGIVRAPLEAKLDAGCDIHRDGCLHPHPRSESRRRSE